MQDEYRFGRTTGDWIAAACALALTAIVILAAIAGSSALADYVGITDRFARVMLFLAMFGLIGFMFMRAFWVLLLGLGALAALVAMAAYIVHFQILPAFGLAILAIVLGSLCAGLSRG